MTVWILFISFLFIIYSNAQGTVDVARHSFKPPLMANQIPFWSAGAGAYINTTWVRITPAKQSRTGFLWNTAKSMMVDWEVIFEFRVTGLRGLGGDGFAFWYTDKAEMLGTVYGSADFWNGLAIIFDTFNNDGRGESPLISAMFNDGTQRYNPADDGASQALASCSFPFRNLGDMATAKITYQGNILSVQIALHRDQANQPAFVDCLRVEDVILGVDKYFGLTAHTGDVADNHDIGSFTTRDLSAKGADVNTARERYRERIQYQHAQPSHQEMSARDFQHEVLTLLNQIQEELNMMETSQINVENVVNSIAAVIGGGVTTDGEGGAFFLAAPQDHQLVTAADNTILTLRKIEELVEFVKQRGGSATPPGPPVPPPPPAQYNSNNNQAQQQAIPSSIVSDVSSRLDSANSRLLGELKNSFNEQIRKLTESGRQLQNDQRQLQSQLQTVVEECRNARGGGGVGFLFYTLLFFILVGVVAIAIFLHKSNSERSKYL